MISNIRKTPRVKIFIYYYLPLLFWMGIIFYFSSQSGSGTPIKDWQFYVERKGAHIVEYFLLSLLFLRIIFVENRASISRERSWLPYLAVFVFSFCFAVFDELHQFFVFGREGKFSDVGIDVVGIILGIFVYYFSTFLLPKRKVERKENGRTGSIRQ
jgi:VanZ family protein